MQSVTSDNVYRSDSESSASFLVKKEPRTPDEVIIVEPHDLWPLGNTWIRADDEEKFRQFYKLKFSQMHQNFCKKVVKEWIKQVQEKKQSIYPYNGGKKARALNLCDAAAGDCTRPPWWPAPSLCAHKEPDHIEKDGTFQETLDVESEKC